MLCTHHVVTTLSNCEVRRVVDGEETAAPERPEAFGFSFWLGQQTDMESLEAPICIV